MLNRLSYGKFLLIAVAIMLAAAYILMDSLEGVPVLNYHMVNDQSDSRLAVGTSEFRAQMDYLAKRGYTSITTDELMGYLKKGTPLPPKPVLITFDDGYRDNYTNAYPILAQYGFTATIFLITDYVGNDDWYLNWAEVKEMQQKGFVFGSHTLSHTPLTAISLEEAEKQLRVSREVLEWRLNAPVTYLAYPTGAYNDTIKTMTERAGYHAAFTVDFGKVAKGDDVFTLKRIPMFKSHLALANFYLRLELTPVANMLRDIKEKIWPAPPEEDI